MKMVYRVKVSRFYAGDTEKFYTFDSITHALEAGNAILESFHEFASDLDIDVSVYAAVLGETDCLVYEEYLGWGESSEKPKIQLF